MKKKVPTPTLGQQYQQLLDKRDRAEAKLIRAFNAWVAARQDVKRMEKRLDQKDRENLTRNEIGGALDIREITEPTKPHVLSPELKAALARMR